MAAIFKVDGLDLSVHLRVNQGDGLDPYGQNPIEPQFAEGALSDGDPLLSVREDNRQQEWQLILNPAKAGYTASKDGLLQLVRDIARVLRNAQQIEWRDDGATSSTYFDVQFARFDPAWDFRRSQKLWVAGAVKAWTKPYGNTGTTRVIGTAVGSLAAAQVSIASGALGGDADADVFATLSVATVPQDELLVGLSVGPAAGWVPVWPAASVFSAATLIGASGAYASQAARLVVGSGPQPMYFSIGATTVPSGLHRVIALARTTTATGVASAVAVVAVLNSAALVASGAGALGATQLLPTGRDWRILDLGTFAGGTSILPGDFVKINGALMSASAGATGLLDIAAAFVLPESKTVVAFTPSGLLNVQQVASYTFDGVGRSFVAGEGNASQVANLYRLDNYLRGDFPRLPVGSGRTAFAFAVPDNDAQNHAVSVDIRCRERFTFHRV